MSPFKKRRVSSRCDALPSYYSPSSLFLFDAEKRESDWRMRRRFVNKLLLGLLVLLFLKNFFRVSRIPAARTNTAPVSAQSAFKAKRQTNNHKMSNPLPSPDQKWAHAVDSQAVLKAALHNDAISAIETDVLMGTCITTVDDNGVSNNAKKRKPIMAHPPRTKSDLSMTSFFDIITDGGQAAVEKVIKLDFKELETIEPTLQEITRRNVVTREHAAFFLNADILPGPGKREPTDVTIPAKIFMETCLKYILPQQSSSSPSGHNNATRFALSLGFKTDCLDSIGYTVEDLQAMAQLITEYRLEENHIGVVLALNARELTKSLSSLDAIMKEFPHLEILAWTGKGEPLIPRSFIQLIQDHFESLGMSHRVGFDCQISEYRLIGASIEFVVSAFALAQVMKKAIFAY